VRYESISRLLQQIHLSYFFIVEHLEYYDVQHGHVTGVFPIPQFLFWTWNVDFHKWSKIILHSNAEFCIYLPAFSFANTVGYY